MILSASVNADVPAHHGDWFSRRLEAGYLRVAGADPWKQRRIALDAAHVDGIVFWTRDVAPFEPVLESVQRHGMRFIVQYALTQARTEASAAAIAAMRRLAARFGPRVVVWRYDPVELNEPDAAKVHVDAFGTLAKALAGVVEEAIVAFARPSSPAPVASTEASERRDLVRRLAEIGRGSGMRLSVCADADALAPGASPARCIDARRLAEITGRPPDAPTAGFMRDCLCARAVDIGDHGGSLPERFCGAAPNRRLRLRHDPASEFLFEPRQRFRSVRPGDFPF